MKLILGLFLLILPAMALAENTPLTISLPFRQSRNAALNEYISFITETMKEAGFDIVVKTMTLKKTYNLLADGDVQATVYDDKASDEGRDKIVTTSFPILLTKGLIFYNVNLKNFNPDNLKKYKGAFSQNNVVLIKKAKKEGLKFTTTVTPYQSIQLMREGKIDYFIGVAEVAQAAVDASPDIKELIKTSDTIFAELPLYFSLSKVFAKDLPRIEAAFKKSLKGDLSKYPLIKDTLNKDPK